MRPKRHADGVKPSGSSGQPLHGKVAVVTGSSRGIGRAIARRLAHDGALVVVNYVVNADAASEVVSGIEEGGDEAFAVGADVSSPADIQALFAPCDAELRARRGDNGIDILVNNAGAGRFGGPADTTE